MRNGEANRADAIRALVFVLFLFAVIGLGLWLDDSDPRGNERLDQRMGQDDYYSTYR